MSDIAHVRLALFIDGSKYGMSVGSIDRPETEVARRELAQALGDTARDTYLHAHGLYEAPIATEEKP